MGFHFQFASCPCHQIPIDVVSVLCSEEAKRMQNAAKTMCSLAGQNSAANQRQMQDAANTMRSGAEMNPAASQGQILR